MHKIGVLAIQGDFFKHSQVVKDLGHEAVEVRTKKELYATDGLIIPGGESTTFLRLFAEFDLRRDIIDYARVHPVMGTCAGLIILSSRADHLPYAPLSLIDISVSRNAYGRQKESFVDDITLFLNGKSENYPGVFIRAPKIDQIGRGVKVLAKHRDDIVMVMSDNILAATFHPELTGNSRVHRFFIENFI